MKCPNCDKELTKIKGYGQCFQEVTITENGKPINYSSPEVLEGDYAYECPECCEDLTEFVKE